VLAGLSSDWPEMRGRSGLPDGRQGLGREIRAAIVISGCPMFHVKHRGGPLCKEYFVFHVKQAQRSLTPTTKGGRMAITRHETQRDLVALRGLPA
jgi:hypothetical protein